MKLPILFFISGASLALVGAGGVYLSQPAIPTGPSTPLPTAARDRILPLSLPASRTTPNPTFVDRNSPRPESGHAPVAARFSPPATAHVSPTIPPANQTTTAAAVPSPGRFEDVPEVAADGGPALGEPRAVNPAAVGNAFVFRGVRVAVAEAYPSAGGGGTALGVDLTPEAGAPLASSALGEQSGNAAAASTLSKLPGNETGTVSDPEGDEPSALADTPTVETPKEDAPTQSDSTLDQGDQYFRMKWGWAAYDAAKREAAREAANLGTP